MTEGIPRYAVRTNSEDAQPLVHFVAYLRFVCGDIII